MNRTRRNKLFAARRVLQNPYAYIDELDGDDDVTGVPEPAKSQRRAERSVRRYSDDAIKRAARDLHLELWHRRHELWAEPPADAVDLIDIGKALELVGYRLELRESLGFRVARKGQIEVAGFIDRDRRVVGVSKQFSGPSLAFTMAHELGHAVLHPEGGGVHRDRSRDVPGLPKNADEAEADRFAVHFLMPERLVRERFEVRFGRAPFVLDEATAFALVKRNHDIASERFPTPRSLSRHLANVEEYDTREFDSMASLFGVSVVSMAIRLEELGLVSG